MSPVRIGTAGSVAAGEATNHLVLIYDRQDSKTGGELRTQKYQNTHATRSISCTTSSNSVYFSQRKLYSINYELIILSTCGYNCPHCRPPLCPRRPPARPPPNPGAFTVVATIADRSSNGWKKGLGLLTGEAPDLRDEFFLRKAANVWGPRWRGILPEAALRVLPSCQRGVV